MTVPRILLTPGEPAGIGPDLAVQIAQRPQAAEVIAVADAALLRARAEQLGLPLTIHRAVLADAPRPSAAGELRVLDVKLDAPAAPGELNPANAPYVLQTLRAALAACKAGQASALVTGPVQKSVMNEADIPFSGHTEFLAVETGGGPAVMLLARGDLRVALATTHLPLAEVPAAITPARLTEVLEVLHRELRARFDIREPVIAALGLNPHAGEGGHLGREEIEVIAPALATLRGQGMNLLGPLPADTAFSPAMRQRADCFLAMYHDQGLPALKYGGVGEAVNITLGLPLIRTSVDHGTALDLAGTGQADPGSLQRALDCAIDLAKRE